MMFSKYHLLLRLSSLLIKLFKKLPKKKIDNNNNSGIFSSSPVASLFFRNVMQIWNLKDMLIKSQIKLVIKILLPTPYGAFRYSWLYFSSVITGQIKAAILK